MGIDINKLVESLDENTLKALQDALNAQTANKTEEQSSKEEEKKDEELSQDKLEEALKDKGMVSKSRKVKPNIYHVTIAVDEWEKSDDGGAWINKREVYTDKYQLRESSILSIHIDEDKMLEGLEGDELTAMNEFIDDIYDRQLIKIKSDNLIGTFTWLSDVKPAYDVSVIVQELPFPDCPASSLGL